MAGSPSWFEWLWGLLPSAVRPSPAPGSREARLEEHRVGARLDRERRKPAGQRDEELIHALRVEYRKIQLENSRAKAARLARMAAAYEQPAARECCAAAGWVRPRLAASYRALHDYCCQDIEQIKEELAAAEARRPPVIVAEPALRLELPAALQQPPPRLDMCSVCAQRIQQAELSEESFREHAAYLRNSNRLRGLHSAPAAAATSQEAAGRAPAAANLPAGEAQAQSQQGQQQQGQQQQQQREQQQGQQQQQQQHVQWPCGGDSVGDGSEEAPATPTHVAMAPTQQQHTSSEQEQELEPRQECEAAEERQLQAAS